MKERDADPRALDVAALCRDGARLDGQLPLAALPRLAASVLADADGASTVLTWSAEGATRAVRAGAPELWLTLKAAVTVRLQCQRCLNPLPWELSVDRRVLFVRGEAEAERLDEDLEEDVLALEPRHDLLALIEDELILALPLVPRHDDCPQPLAPPASGLEDAPPRPFAALERLRGRLS